jgi:hypothetical protein
MTWTTTLRALGGALLAAMLLSLPACEDGTSNDKPAKDDAKAAAKDTSASVADGDAKPDDEADAPAKKTVATPRPVTGTTPGATPASDKGTDDTAAKGDDTTKKLSDDKTGDTAKGDDKAAAQPPTTGKRGSGADVGGDCPCRRGLRCCDGKCKTSC